MIKTYCTDYIRHCLRFYTRYNQPKSFSTQADRKNWYACHTVMEQLDKGDRELLYEVYRNGDTIPDNIYRLAKGQGIPQDDIWKLVANLEYRIAQRRGLI